MMSQVDEHIISGVVDNSAYAAVPYLPGDGLRDRTVPSWGEEENSLSSKFKVQ